MTAKGWGADRQFPALDGIPDIRAEVDVGPKESGRLPLGSALNAVAPAQAATISYTHSSSRAAREFALRELTDAYQRPKLFTLATSGN